MKNYWLPKDERGIKAQTKALRELREELECWLNTEEELETDDIGTIANHGEHVCSACRSYGGNSHRRNQESASRNH